MVQQINVWLQEICENLNVGSLNYGVSIKLFEAPGLAGESVTELVTKSEQVMGFWLKAGHPFYPVYWDYAFLFEVGNDAFVLIGSSSD